MLKSKKHETPTLDRFFFFSSFHPVMALCCSNPFTVVTQHHCHYYVTIPAVISEQLMHGIRTVLWHFENYYSGHLFALGDPGHLQLTVQRWMQPIFMFKKPARVCIHARSAAFIPCGRVMQAPSTIACASSRSLHSAARAAARSASQISLRPSKAGAVSQNSSLLLLSWPSVIGYSLFHFGRSFFRGSLRPKIRTKAVLNLARGHE